MPLITSPDPPSATASRMGSELPTSRSTEAEEDSLPDNPEDEERNGLEIASAALGRPEKMGEVPFYAGKRKQECRIRNTAVTDDPNRWTDGANFGSGYLRYGAVLAEALSHSPSSDKLV